MSRRRRGLSPTLFPFLAVLVCTLGTLILLLALVTRKAEHQARRDATVKVTATLQAAEDVADWQRDSLLEIRQKQTADLETRRSQLAHIEDHLRRLDQELRLMTDKIVASQSKMNVTELENEVKRLQEKAISLQAEIDQKKDARPNGELPPRVAILPYRGANGTQRRPIYIECVHDQIVIQPEGVRIAMEALRGPMGPGNPLDAALRAARVHWQAVEPSPPYPLLVVRPSGIIAYAAARVAMTAWDDQFGYELVPEDIELEFPEQTPILKEKLRVAIAEAMERRDTLIAAMPQRFQVGGNTGSLDRAIEEAGEARNALAQDPLNQWRGGQSKPTGMSNNGNSANRLVNQGGGMPTVAENSAKTGSGLGDFPSDGGLAGSNDDVAQGGMLPRKPLLGGSPLNQIANDAGSSYGNNNEQSGGAGQPPLLAPANGNDSSRVPGSNQLTGSTMEFGEQGSQGSPNETNGSPSTNGSQQGSPTTTKGSVSGGASPTKLPGSQAGGGSSLSMSGGEPASDGNSQQQPNTTSSSMSPTLASAAQASSLANKRGKDWALPESARTSGPSVVRHLRVACYANRYELEVSPGRTRKFAIDPAQPEAAVVSLASVVRQRVDSWGPALSGGRWQPTLIAGIAPDGYITFQILAKSMEGSGVVVKQGRNP